MSDAITISLQEAEALSNKVLTHNGFSQTHADAITRSVIAAQRDECHSHGLYRLIGCVQTALNDGVDTQAEPTITDQATSVVKVNANKGCSLLSFERGKPYLIEKARHNGIAAQHCGPKLKHFQQRGLWR